MKKVVLLLSSLLLLGLLLAACTATPVDENKLATEVAATIYAGQTIEAGGVTDALPSVGTPTEDIPSAGSTATPTFSRTPTPRRTSTSVPTQTPTPAPSKTPTPTFCLPDANFGADVTVPDGANFAPGEGFTKTWRMLSTGCAPWPAGSVWAFDSGDQMGAPGSVPAPDTPLGGSADISVEMVAPAAPGTYKGFWQMQNPDGARFGERVYVMIVVPAPTPVPKSCPPNPALVEVINQLSIQLTVEVKGPQNATFLLPGNTTRHYCTIAGTYDFTARASGYSPLTGTKTFDSGACQCWWFYSGFQVHPICSCDGDASHYVPLP
jgi:hypothetical protein